MSDKSRQQRCLDYDLAREIQRDIEALDGAWSSSLRSLAQRPPNAYRVEVTDLAALNGAGAAALAKIAKDHGVVLSIRPDPDRSPPKLLIVFDRPGSWYAEG